MVYAFIGIPLDVIAEAATQALEARFPERAPDDALPYHGRDRGIIRGPLELAASYRIRLLLWLEAWRGAGVGRALLDQVAGYLSPNACRLRLWTQVGVVYTLEADGTFSITRSASPWNWDQRPELWSRFWLLIYSTGGIPWTHAGTFADRVSWGDPATSTFASTATQAEAQSIAAIVDQWKPAAALCQNVLVVFNSAKFNPAVASDLPDGTWGEYWDTISGLASRSREVLYWKGV
jgi:hypothetical protein